MPIDFFTTPHILEYGRSIQVLCSFQERALLVTSEKGKYEEFSVVDEKTNPGGMTPIIILIVDT
jgi:hypothetical protein